VPVTFVTFDLLHLDGEDLTARPLAERKRLLDGLQLLGPAWAANGWYPGEARSCSPCAASTDTRASPSGWTLSTSPAGGLRTWLKRKTPEWKRDHAPRHRPP
jgi:hypothetical protein